MTDVIVTGTGMGLGLIGKVTARSGTVETGPINLGAITPTTIVVPAPADALAALGVALPFDMTIRIYQNIPPYDYTESDIIEVVDGPAPPIANPLLDAQFAPSDAGALTFDVGGTTLYYFTSLIPGDGAVTSFPITVPPGANPSHSFAVWFSSINAPTQADVFAFCQMSGIGNFEIEVNGALDLDGIDGGQTLHASGPFAEDPTWHLFVVTRDGNDVSMYWDGVQISFDSGGGFNFNNPSPTLIVGKVSGPFNSIGTGAVWFRALSAQEVTDLFALTTFPP